MHAIFMFPSSLDDAVVDDIVDNHLVPGSTSSNARAMTTRVGPLMGAGGPSPYGRIVHVTHASIDDMMRAAKAGGKELDAHMKQLGVQLIAYEAREL